MRVALDARVATDHFPGIGRSAVQLAAALARLLPTGDLLTLQPPAAARARFGAPAGAPLTCAASPFSLAQQWEVPRRLHAAAADVYHSFYFGMPLWPGVPTVWTCHDLIPLLVPGLFGPGRRAVIEALHVFAARTARHVVVPSQATRDALVRHLRLDPARITVVPWGVDDRFRAAPARAAAPPSPAGWPARYLLFVGINKPHKNLPRVVRAVARAQAERPARDLHLVVAGPWDPRYPEPRAAAAEAGIAARVHFLGPVDDAELPALYAGATAFLFPSLYEGFGLPILEALASGVATITSDRAGLAELAGGGALAVPPEDEPALAHAIGRVVDEPGLREELARKGRERAADFTWERAATAYLAVYRSLAPGTRAGGARATTARAGAA